MRNEITIAVIVVLFFVSGVMALAETAFTRVSRIKLRARAEDGDRRAERLLTLFDQPENTLNSVLLVVLVSQMTSATLLGSLLESWGGWVGFLIGTIAEVFIFFTFAEVAPKTYASQTSGTCRPRALAAPRRDGQLQAAAVVRARLHRPGECGVAGQGTAEGPVRHRSRDPRDGRRRGRRRGDRERAEGAHPLACSRSATRR